MDSLCQTTLWSSWHSLHIPYIEPWFPNTHTKRGSLNQYRHLGLHHLFTSFPSSPSHCTQFLSFVMPSFSFWSLSPLQMLLDSLVPSLCWLCFLWWNFLFRHAVCIYIVTTACAFLWVHTLSHLLSTVLWSKESSLSLRHVWPWHCKRA